MNVPLNEAEKKGGGVILVNFGFFFVCFINKQEPDIDLFYFYICILVPYNRILF